MVNSNANTSLPWRPGWILYHSDSMYVPQPCSSTEQQYNYNRKEREYRIVYFLWGMSPWWPLLALIAWCPTFKLSYCNWGLQNQFFSVPIFSTILDSSKLICLLNITFIFDRCHCSWALVTHVKYECDSKHVTYTFATRNLSLTIKLTQGYGNDVSHNATHFQIQIQIFYLNLHIPVQHPIH